MVELESLSAVLPAHPAAGQWGLESLVAPIPNEAALEPGHSPDQIPKFIKVPQRIPFRVGVFAHDHRPLLGWICQDVAYPIEIRIHGSQDVADRGRWKAALILDRTRRIGLPHPVGHGCMMRSKRGLVT